MQKEDDNTIDSLAALFLATFRERLRIVYLSGVSSHAKSITCCVEDLIENFPDPHYTIAKMRKKLRKNSHSLSHRFAQRLGCCPRDFLKQLRTLTAAGILSIGCDVQTAAHHSGFFFVNKMKKGLRDYSKSDAQPLRDVAKEALNDWFGKVDSSEKARIIELLGKYL